MVGDDIMESPSRTVNYAHLVETAAAIGRAIGAEPVAPDVLEERIKTILHERHLLEAVDNHAITELEAADVLLGRVETWLHASPSSSHRWLTDYSRFERDAVAALFGAHPPAASSNASG